jgi:histidyl-tRNA synthetase
MSTKLQSVRGTQDFIAPQSLLYRNIEQTAWTAARCYGYSEIMTPIFEFSEVFHRSLGETSDAVSKETYDFKDRGGETLTLRPEGTAGVVRAFINNGLAQHLPLKLYYTGPMFRYERPQKGRYRQFHQIGAEALGFDSARADVESIALAAQILKDLGLMESISLEINSLGDRESRSKHREGLVQYLTPFKNSLSADSQIRLEKNPLRILDSKDQNDRKIIAEAPSLHEFLNDTSRKFFDEVLGGLANLGLKYTLNPQLVRGLDYYTHTVFEFVTTHLGAQGAVLSGGRYDGLVESMGGPPTPGVGWGAGLERLMLLVEQTQPAKLQDNTLRIAVLAAEDLCAEHCLRMATVLRSHGFVTEALLQGNMGKNMKRANKINARFCVIYGSSERSQNLATIKDMKEGTQASIPDSDLIHWFQTKSATMESHVSP